MKFYNEYKNEGRNVTGQIKKEKEMATRRCEP